MNVLPTTLAGVLLLEPKVFGDERGFFMESFNARVWTEKTGLPAAFVQDNHSRSGRGVLRGMHYQIKQPQGKLVRAVRGEIFDVVVDIQRRSPTFGKWEGFVLSETNKRMLWAPQGFAHGFLVTSEFAEVLYKTTDYYAPEFERSIIWDDPALGIQWPLNGITPLLSKKDREGVPFKSAEYFE